MRALTRREFIALGAGSAAIATLGGIAYALRASPPRPQPAIIPTTTAQPRGIGGSFVATSLPPPLWITANEDLYVVQYDQVPSVGLTSYTLWVYGLVRNELRLSYDEVRALPTETRMRTLECIGNPAGGNLIGNIVWRGVPMRALLERAGVDARAKFVTIGGIDEYSTSVPIARALDDFALLAFEMNGAPLPLGHGFPLRAILPGVYGQKQPKWVTSIGVLEQEELGPWESRGWSRAATIQLNSAIKIPRPGTPAARGDLLIAGVALTDGIGIRAVEVSADGGKTWRETILTRGPNPYVWTTWGALFHGVAPGRYNVMVRATDNQGNAQDQLASGILANVFPNGTSAMHSIEIEVI
ncbi:MAG: molybdopterin-dependent oxidoreductase [Chloroflexota bacterium]